MADPFGKFSERARLALQSAEEEARRSNQSYIDTGHLLLGLVREGNVVAAKVLVDLGAELTAARFAAEYLAGSGHRTPMDRTGLTRHLKRVIEWSVEEARRLNRHRVDTEHLLLALLREDKGIAVGVLLALGISPDTVRRQLTNVLEGP